MDAFKLLGIEPSFSIDLSDLAARQRELSRALHPDRFVGRPASERRAALGRAIEVNQAHQKLKDPLLRAEVLLDVLGIELSEGERPKAAPELLMDMMERREDLRDAAQAADVSRISHLCEQLREVEARVSTSLAARFANALQNRGLGKAPDADCILEELGELRYYRRFFDEADALIDELT